MKQQDAYKIIAAFLALTMLGSVFAYFFIGAKDTSTQEPQVSDNNLNIYNPDLWTVSEPFYSISDAAKMTPRGTLTAYYIDLESMPPQMIQWARQDFQIIQEVDSLYNSSTLQMYYANLKEGNNSSFLLLSTMYPQKNDFEYIVIPNTTNILQRQDNGAINILGSPAIFGQEKTVGDVLEIIYGLNRSITTYDQYEELLNKVEPAPYQMLTSNVSFARQFYIGVRLINGSYERTTAYFEANSSVRKKLNQLKDNSSQNGFEQFSINQSGNITIVKIVSPELFKVLSEETS